MSLSKEHECLYKEGLVLGYFLWVQKMRKGVIGSENKVYDLCEHEIV